MCRGHYPEWKWQHRTELFKRSNLFSSTCNKKKVRQYEEDIAKCRLLIMDGNIELTTMEYILDLCRSTRVPGKTPNMFLVKLLCKNKKKTLQLTRRFTLSNGRRWDCGTKRLIKRFTDATVVAQNIWGWDTFSDVNLAAVGLHLNN